jgi:hypothetical protein
MRVAYSVPEVHELVAQSWYPRRWSFLERAHPVGREDSDVNQRGHINQRGPFLRQKFAPDSYQGALFLAPEFTIAKYHSSDGGQMWIFKVEFFRCCGVSMVQ